MYWKHNFKIPTDSVDDYDRQLVNRKKEDEDTLSEWIEAMTSLIQIRIKKLNGSVNTHASSIFKDPNFVKHLSFLHNKYVVLNNVFVLLCVNYNTNCLINELSINISL